MGINGEFDFMVELFILHLLTSTRAAFVRFLNESDKRHSDILLASQLQSILAGFACDWFCM